MNQLKLGKNITYTEKKLLGKGNFGEVYECKYKTTDGQTLICAVKISKLGATEPELEYFRKEAQLQLTLDHPNIVKAYEAGSVAGREYIVMELCSGGTLEQYIIKNNKGQPLGEEKSKTFGLIILDTLGYLHSKGVTHRDLKGENIFMDSEHNIKVGDFGLSKESKKTSVLQKMQTVCGTPGYMAPEMIHKEYTDKVDIYAWAITMGLMISGTNFRRVQMTDSSDMREVFVTFKNLEIPSSFSPELKDLLSHCLADLSAARYSAEQAARHPWFASLNKGPQPMAEVRKQSMLLIKNIANETEVANKIKMIQEGVLKYLNYANNSQLMARSAGLYRIVEQITNILGSESYQELTRECSAFQNYTETLKVLVYFFTLVHAKLNFNDSLEANMTIFSNWSGNAYLQKMSDDFNSELEDEDSPLMKESLAAICKRLRPQFEEAFREGLARDIGDQQLAYFCQLEKAQKELIKNFIQKIEIDIRLDPEALKSLSELTSLNLLDLDKKLVLKTITDLFAPDTVTNHLIIDEPFSDLGFEEIARQCSQFLDIQVIFTKADYLSMY